VNTPAAGSGEETHTSTRMPLPPVTRGLRAGLGGTPGTVLGTLCATHRPRQGRRRPPHRPSRPSPPALMIVRSLASVRAFASVLLLPLLLAVLGPPVGRSWRRSSGERRQQLKWLMAGAGILAVSQAVIQPIGSNPGLSPAEQGILNTVSTITLGALPVGLAVAILRYRLYEIDRIISRTLSYTIVSGLLVGVYAGLVLLATEVRSVKSPVVAAVSRCAGLIRPPGLPTATPGGLVTIAEVVG
jgi:hypothetical protein